MSTTFTSSSSSSSSNKDRFKIINDAVHGHITLDKRYLEFIDTPQFQRLRDLKQLGVNYYVYPGAAHNRFEHSIGVCYLAKKWLHKLNKLQPESQRATKDEEFLVALAGLTHDLGHGPFSHVFDSEFIPRARPELKGKWSHEDASVMMLNSLIDDNSIDISSEDVKTVHSLISGEVPNRYVEEGKKYLFQIVANKTNSIDVDKFDYLSRDTLMVGVSTGLFNSERLMKFSKIMNGEICFMAKEAQNIYNMFQLRYNMHRSVYNHRAAKAIEFMMTDVLLQADPYLKISEAIYDPHEYLHLTDNIISTIERSKEPGLKSARELLLRIRKRKLYKLAHETLLQAESPSLAFKEQDIVNCQRDGAGLNADDIIVQDLRINYAMKEKNPVDKVLFFDSGNDVPFLLNKADVSLLIPEKFQERFIRVYSRSEEKLEEVSAAMANYLERFKIPASPYSPSKAKPRHSLGSIPSPPKLEFDELS